MLSYIKFFGCCLMSFKEAEFRMQRQMLTGSDSPNARFGSTIASLFDISNDGYNGRYNRT